MAEPHTSQGGTAAIDHNRMDALRAAPRGSLLLPADSGYDVSRTLWNGMIDRRPAAIVRAVGAADVIHAVNFSLARTDCCWGSRAADTTSPARPPATAA